MAARRNGEPAAAPDGYGDGPVFAAERQAQIERLVAVHGRVRISELVARFGVTEPTLRKDLTALERRRAIKRIHGGAIALKTSLESELDTREALHAEAKEAIAQSCIDEIRDGDAVFLDSGTTVERIARRLAGRNLTVLTNAVAVAQAVCEIPGVEHVLLGGRYRRVSGSLVGPMTMKELERFTVNLAFIGVSGIGDGGLSVADLGEADVKAAVISRARRVVVPVDSSKHGATDFARVCELAEVDLVVTEAASEDFLSLCASREVDVRVARH